MSETDVSVPDGPATEVVDGTGAATAAPAGPVVDGPRRARSRSDALIDFAEKWAAIIGFGAMIAFFWIDSPAFGSMNNLKAILDQAAVPVLLGVGLTVVLASGEFDVSFPYALGLSSAVGTLIMTHLHADATLAVLGGIGAAVVAYAIAGVLVAQQRVASFVITLALGFAWIGVADGLTNSQTITEGFDLGFINLTSHRVAGFTLATVVAAGFALVMWGVLRWTVLGRHILAVGSNPTASRLAGLPISRVRVIAFVLEGIGVGIAAIILTSRQGQYVPDLGTSLFLTPFVAAFFGMSVLGARRFNVLGTVIGALFMGTLQTGLILVGAESWVGELIQGVVLLLLLLIARRK